MKCQRQILHIHWSQHVTNAEISAPNSISAGLRPRRRWGSLQHSPRPLAVFKGAYFKEGEGKEKGMDGKGKRKKRKGKGRGRKGK